MGMELLSDLHTCVVPEAFLLFTNRYDTPSGLGPYRSHEHETGANRTASSAYK